MHLQHILHRNIRPHNISIKIEQEKYDVAEIINPIEYAN